jgi:hypothetical protein
MADVVGDAAAGEPAEHATSRATPLVSASPPPGLEAKSYKGRFTAVYFALAAVLLCAIGLFTYVAVRGSGPAGPLWSAWKPDKANREEMVTQIGQHVAPRYRLAPGGAQLVAVQSTEKASVQEVPVEDVALRGGTSASSDYKIVSTKDAVVYTLCGLGSRCRITKGTPSQARARLLRREALELALYTFKYVPGVDAVLVHIPPPPEPDTSWALFFQKKEFATELSRPLSQTLPVLRGKRQQLVPASVVGNSDQQTVERLTRKRWYTTQYQQLPDGNAILVLDPVIPSN